jgi:DNA polymerase I
MRLWNGIRLIDAPCPDNALRIDLGIMEPVARMNQLGILMDTAVMERIHAEYEGKYETALSALRDVTYPDFNPGSPQQVARLLFDEMGLVPPTGFTYTAGGSPKADSDALISMQGLAPEIIGARGTKDAAPSGILGCNELRKVMGTYTGPEAMRRYLDYDSRIRTDFSIVTARTGRLASRSPNLQNVPPEVRYAFHARPGCVLVSHDKSQIEMVWAAHASGDEVMADIFINGHDMHVRTACAIFKLDYESIRGKWKAYKDGHMFKGTAPWLEMRHFEVTYRLPAKTLGFAILYGASPKGLQIQILTAGGPLMDTDEIFQLIEAWYELYHGVRLWIDRQIMRTKLYGMVWTAFGRPRLMPESRSGLKRVASAGERKAGNTPIQGSAGDHLKVALSQAWYTVVKHLQRYGYCEMLLQIHDEVVAEVEEGLAAEYCALVKETFEGCVPLSVPVRSSVQTGYSWGDLK